MPSVRQKPSNRVERVTFKPRAARATRRVVKALAALPGGLDKIYLRGDSALYEHELMRWLDAKAIGYAISADMSPQLCECIAAMPGDH